MSKHFFLYTDGASKGNPGPAGGGFALINEGKVIKRGTQYFGKATNNLSEHKALHLGLESLLVYMDNLLEIDQLSIRCDSRLILGHVFLDWKCNVEAIREVRDKTIDLVREIKTKGISIDQKQIPRNENKLADNLANLAVKRGF